jgi:uncharacterized membrane protein
MGKKIIEKNIETTLKILYKSFNLNYRKGIYKKMQGHPHYPSLAALQFTLQNEGIETLSLKSDFKQLKEQLPKPTLVHVATNTDLFLLVNRADNENVYILDEACKEQPESITSFLKMWDGTATIFNSENILPRKIPLHEVAKDWLEKLKIPFVAIAFLFIIIYFMVSKSVDRNTLNYLFMLGSTVGLVFAILLQVEGFDEHNPLVKKICTTGSKKSQNCSSILHSKDAYLLRVFSWSDIGLAYFTIIFLYNLFILSDTATSLTIVFSFAAFPYVFYSISYQKFVARSWCRLCLGVQLSISILFALSVLNLSKLQLDFLHSIYQTAILLMMAAAVIAAIWVIKPLISSSFELKNIAPKYRWLKHNTNVLQLLNKAQQQIASARSCALICGNPNAETVLTLVISPVCNPCMNELNELLPILKRKNNTRIEILFLTEKEEIAPEEFNLALTLIGFYKKESGRFLETLFSYVDNYPASKFRYTELHNLPKQEARELFAEQITYCVSHKIFVTPKIFLNGYELPNLYTANDIDYMCS